MAHGWCFLLLTLGVCGLSSMPRQFHYMNEKNNWKAAQQYCREEFTDLATIHDMTEIDEIKRVIQNAGVGEGWRVWIGLKNGSSPKWQWSLADEGFYGKNETDEFWNWEHGRPQGSVGEDCGSIHQDGKWTDIPCTSAIRFICYNGTNPTHPYVLVEDMKTWADAQSYCREKHTDLATIRNQAENDKIKELINPVTTGLWTRYFFWIGLFRDAWEWSDGSNSSFRDWSSGEPTNDGLCVEMFDSGLWNDVPCDTLYYFVCYEALPNATVDVVSPPLPFYSGDDVTLRCDIAKYSDWHQYVWLKDNSLVPGKTSETINITLPLEAGQYQCSGERGDRPMASSVSSSVNIISNDLPNATMVVSPPPPFYSGDEITLKCNITHYTDWRYSWLKDNIPVPGKTNQNITITLPLEAGRYQCSGQRQDRPMASTVSSSVDIISNAVVKRTQIVRVEMEMASDVDVEDPGVQEAFLKQTKERLKAKGLPANAQLSWRVQPDGKVFHKKKNDKKKEKRDEF